MEKETKNIYQKLFEVKKAWIKLQRDTKAFNYKYATLSQIQEKFWEKLQEQWLLIMHSIVENKVRTQIFDTEWKSSVCSEIEMAEWTKAQDKWSEITYYRRYNLLSLLDLEVEDDDWAKASNNSPEVKEEVVWFDEDKFEWLKKAKSNFSNSKEAILACRKKYWVSKKWASDIESLYN